MVQILVESYTGRTFLPEWDAGEQITGEKLRARISQHFGLPLAEFRVKLGKTDITNETIVQPFSRCQVLLGLRGGKGAFGASLKSQKLLPGQKKVTSKSSCRTLDGVRVRVSKQVQLLKEWSEKKQELDAEKQKDDDIKRQERIKAAELAAEKVSDNIKLSQTLADDTAFAVSEGLLEAKRSREASAHLKEGDERQRKRARHWDDWDDLDEYCELSSSPSPSDSTSTSTIPNSSTTSVSSSPQTVQQLFLPSLHPHCLVLTANAHGEQGTECDLCGVQDDNAWRCAECDFDVCVDCMKRVKEIEKEKEKGKEKEN